MATLYIVPTPIGNLKDITFNAIEVLSNIDFILSEDTRRTIKLLNHYKISKKLISYHRHSSPKKEEEVINKLKQGLNVALVSSAGTPLIADPGESLVKKAIDENIKVVVLPGASSVITSVCLSGFDTGSFAYAGWMPRKNSKRIKIVKKFLDVDITTIFFESPFRIKKTLLVLKESFPEIKVAIARELTKIHEECLRGNICDVFDTIKDREVKGEVVLVIRR